MGLPQSECAPSGDRDIAKGHSYAVTLASRWGLTLTSSDVALDIAATCGGVKDFSKVTVTRRFATAAPKLIKPLADQLVTVSACFPNGTTN